MIRRRRNIIASVANTQVRKKMYWKRISWPDSGTGEL
jgi:hypothetical protein